MIVIVNQGLMGSAINHTDESDVGSYLERYDPNYMLGDGAAWWTPDIDKAQRFADLTEAWECWRQTSTIKPLRADGLPNRPLTAYSITFKDIE